MSVWKFPVLGKYTAREMQRRPGRTILTLLGIVFGVAAIVAISVTTATTHRAYRDMFESVAGRASLEVVADGFGGFEPEAVKSLESVQGVETLVPVIQIPTVLLGSSGAVSALVLGVDPASDKAARKYTLRAGRQLEAGDVVLMEAGFARSQGCALGKPARLLTPLMTPTGPMIAALPVVGLLEPEGAAAFNGGAVIFMPLTSAQRLFALKNQVNSVQIVLADGANLRQVEAEISKRLPAGLTVQSPAMRGELAQDALLSTELGLGTLSVVSLVAGAFVILNSFLMNLGERRRQLAILRSLGATRGQVTRLLLREAGLLGVTGTAVGILAGLALSFSLRRIMEQLLGVALPPMRLTASPFVYALILGPGMALAATYLPARRSGRRAPLEDLLQKQAIHVERLRKWPSYVGVMLLLSTLALEFGLLKGWVPPSWIGSLLAFGTAMTLIGAVLAIPLLLPVLTRLAAFLLRPWLGMEGRLAFRHLERHPVRTSLTVGVLFIGVAVSIAFGQSMRNNIRDVYRWCDRNVAFDFFVRGMMPDTTTLIATAPLPEELAEQIAGLDGVDRVQKVNFILARAENRQIIALPCSFEESRPLSMALASGDPQQALRGLVRGQVVLGSPLAHRLGLGVGDHITLETRQGPKALRIAGTTAEYTAGGMALYLDWNKGKELFDIRGVHAFVVMAKKGAVPVVAPRLKSFCDEHGLRFQSNADLRDALDRAMGGVVGFYWGLVVLVFVVASLGVVNTLTMNVLEQTRELGILRAVAMRRGQVRKMIFSQALALGMISLLPGIAVGVALAYLMNLATKPVLGNPVAFYLDGTFVGGCFLVALVIAVLSAYFPARRAARLKVIEALQYE
jgi:putative ABC transport system permease protein